MIAAIVSGVLALGVAILVVSAAPAKAYWFLGTAWLFWAFLALGIESKRDQSRWARLGDWLPLPYDWVMERVLRGLPRLLLPQSIVQMPRPGGGYWRNFDWYITPLARDPADRVRLAGNPWSWPVFDVALRIAILYPLLFALFQWTLTGNSTGLGGLELFPEGVHWLLRTAALCLIAALIVSRILASATSKGVYEKLSMWLFFAALAVAVAVAVAWSTRAGRGQIGYTALTATAIAGTAAAAALLPPEATEAAIWIVGLALLPSVNAVFDYLSYGLTIWLLRQGHRWRRFWPWVFGAADALAAAAMFFALSLALTALIALINRLRDAPLIDLDALLTAARAGEPETYWVVAMVASTLVPTLLHIAIAILSAVTWIPARAWRGMAAALDGERSAQVSLLASLGLTLALAIYAAIPAGALYGLGWAIWTYGGSARELYVDALRSVLGGLGLL